MCTVFNKAEAQALVAGKSFLFIGDSIMRNMYKDLIYLVDPSAGNGLIPRRFMTTKGEQSFQGDKLFEKSELNQGRSYVESRDWYCRAFDAQLSFIFVTRCFDERIERMMENYPEKFGTYPDVIMVSSALWDINRWGPRGIDKYKANIERLMELFKSVLPSRTQVIWMTTPPISVEIQGGFMIKQLEFQEHSMRYNIVEGNQYAATLTACYGYDVLDMHYYFVHQVHRRSLDGIHWNPDSVRVQVCIFLTHYCLSWGLPLPEAPQGTERLLQAAKEIAQQAVLEVGEELERMEVEEPQPGPSDRLPGPPPPRKVVIAKRTLPRPGAFRSPSPPPRREDIVPRMQPKMELEEPQPGPSNRSPGPPPTRKVVISKRMLPGPGPFRAPSPPPPRADTMPRQQPRSGRSRYRSPPRRSSGRYDRGSGYYNRKSY